MIGKIIMSNRDSNTRVNKISLIYKCKMRTATSTTRAKLLATTLICKRTPATTEPNPTKVETLNTKILPVNPTILNPSNPAMIFTLNSKRSTIW